jgi:hypothetical protein
MVVAFPPRDGLRVSTATTESVYRKVIVPELRGVLRSWVGYSADGIRRTVQRKARSSKEAAR